jgi:hypothetical protein
LFKERFSAWSLIVVERKVYPAAATRMARLVAIISSTRVKPSLP